MLLALSNALGLPIVIFSSALHYPIIHVLPRVRRAAIPLYVAFWCRPLQRGIIQRIIECDYIKIWPWYKVHMWKRWEGQFNTALHSDKYTTSLHCSCHRTGHGCIPLCQCTNYSRERKKHGWNLIPIKSAQYGKGEGCNGTTSPLEYLLACRVLSLLRRNEINRNLRKDIHCLFVTMSRQLHDYAPWSKTCNEISSIISEYDRNKDIFESTCIAQLKVTHLHDFSRLWIIFACRLLYCQ